MRLLIRWFYWCVIFSIKRQHADELRCMKECKDRNTYWRIYFAHEQTNNELKAAESAYKALLQVGKRRTWKTA